MIPKALIVKPRLETDYVKGANSKIIYQTNVPSGDWGPYLPSNEPQKYGNFDTDECTQLSAINCVEIQLNFLKATGKLSSDAIAWFSNNGYLDAQGLFALSERFTGTHAGTNINGNTITSPWDSMRHFGLLPRADLGYSVARAVTFPTQQAMCADYYNSAVITPAMNQKALGVFQWINIQYEWVGAENQPVSLNEIAYSILQAPIHVGVPVCNDSWNNVMVPVCPSQEASHCVAMYDKNLSFRDQYNPYNKGFAQGYRILQGILGVVTPVPPEPAMPSVPLGTENEEPTQVQLNGFQAILQWISGRIQDFKNRNLSGVGLGVKRNWKQIFVGVIVFSLVISNVFLLLSLRALSKNTDSIKRELGVTGQSLASTSQSYQLSTGIIASYLNQGTGGGLSQYAQKYIESMQVK